MVAVARVGHVVTGVRVVTRGSVVVVAVQGVGLDPIVPVRLGRRFMLQVPDEIVPVAVRSGLVIGRAHRFLSGQPAMDTL